MKSKFPITKAAQVLRYLRKKAGVSQVELARRLSVSEYTISHIENGGMRLPQTRIQPWVHNCGYLIVDYNNLMSRTEAPVHQRDECLQILNELSEEKLKLVHSILVQFSK